MSLDEALERLEQGSACRVSVVFNSLSEDDKSTFTRWVEERQPVGWMSRVILEAYPSKGFSDKSAARHFRGVCKCPDGMNFKGTYRTGNESNVA